MELLAELLGRLHPLVVHLPIGFLVLAALVYFKTRHQKDTAALLATLFLWTGIAAAMACGSGYLLYRSGGYSYETVAGHLWFGVVTALFCFLMYGRWKPRPIYRLQEIPGPALLALGLGLMVITGHKGGNLTHGEGYLTEPLPRSMKKILGIPVFEQLPIALTADTWQDADLYADVVHPILNNKCVGCHGPGQAKGGLRLHEGEKIIAGGKNGKVIVAHEPGQSELVSRIDSPREDEGHMPPKEKDPLSAEEIALLKAWIGAGHPFEGTISSHGLDIALFEPFFPKNAADLYPDATLAPVPADSLETARKAGLHVELLGRDLPWLRVSALNKPDFSLADTLLLAPLAKHIVDLDLSGTRVDDSIYTYLGNLPNLTVLNLAHTDITDRNIEKLAGLSHLKRLNLTFTGVTADLLPKLEQFAALEEIFVFGTALPAGGPQRLKNGTITVEYGGYDLPAIASDSIVY
jgi:uncharacterized membrane protein/mono/diheme cytochrome c family protein